MFKRMISPYLHAIVLTATLAFAPQAFSKQVFASVEPHAYFVQKIAGDLVDVHVMVGSGHNPHTYEPTPRQMSHLRDSDIFFTTGVPFESVWLPRIQANYPDIDYVNLQQNVDLLTMAEVCTDPSHNHAHDHNADDPASEGHHHHHEGTDPHIWLSPKAAKVQSRTIFETLKRHYPEHAETLADNYTKWVDELDTLHQEINAQLKPLQNRTFYVYHPAWGYFARDFELTQKAVEIDGKEPSARQLGSLIEQARNENVKVIFVQEQFSTRLAESVAEAIGGRVTSIDPLARNYVENLRSVATLLAETLQ